MGILNPKGNLYSKVPLIPGQIKATPTGVGRNPMSPLPEPPSTAPTSTTTTTTEAEVFSPADANESISHQPRTRTSIVDVSDQNNQSFTTSIYLNQSAAATGKQPEVEGASSVPAPTQQHVIPARSYEPVTVIPPVTSSATATTTSSTVATTTPSSGIKGIKWSVYLSKSKPTRHVTVIPINNNNLDVEAKPPSSPTEKEQPEITTSTEELQKSEEEFEGEHFYDAIFELEEGANSASATSAPATSKTNNVSLARPKRERRRQQSPPPKAPPLPTSYETIVLQSNESRCVRVKYVFFFNGFTVNYRIH